MELISTSDLGSISKLDAINDLKSVQSIKDKSNNLDAIQSIERKLGSINKIVASSANIAEKASPILARLTALLGIGL